MVVETAAAGGTDTAPATTNDRLLSINKFVLMEFKSPRSQEIDFVGQTETVAARTQTLMDPISP